ncbi:MAG TPA: YlmC/YmxH family sporulation protein [Spirochaetia bacterium]|nr:YlmC/YmxH family sporulation protein [Spirochaetia bacterium]
MFSLYKISELSRRDFINVADGMRLGPIKDVHIDRNTGRVTALVLRGNRKYWGMLGLGTDVVVPWEKIRKVGADAVLVELEPVHR